MKRAILLAAAGAAVSVFALAGCSDKCDTCGVRHEETACCEPATGGEVRQGAPVERRTEVRRPGAAATRSAR